MKLTFGISPQSYRHRHRAAAAVAILGMAQSASAQVPAELSSDKSVFTLFNPTPRALMRSMSTDRPDTTESPYTVDAGHFQIELSFVDFAYDRNYEDAQTIQTFAVLPMLLKVGLLNNVDLQLGIDPYTQDRITDWATDISGSVQGFGDTVVRLKVNLWGNDGGETAFALMPFVKFPTASGGLGNGDIEGGLIAPLAIALPNEFSLTVMAEVDFRRSAADDCNVVAFVHSATVSHDLFGDLSGYVEYAGFLNLNGGENYLGFFDTGLTYSLTPDVQLDCGVRLGLTEAADDLGVFAGISLRF